MEGECRMVNWWKKHGQAVKSRKRWQVGLILVSIGMIFVSSPVHAVVRDTTPTPETINQWVGANQPTKSILTAVPTLDIVSERLTSKMTTIQVKANGVLTANADITSCSIQLLDKDGQKISIGGPENLKVNGKSVYFNTRVQSSASTRSLFGNVLHIIGDIGTTVTDALGSFSDWVSTIFSGPKNPWVQTLTMTGDLKLKVPVYIALVIKIQGKEYKYALIRFAEQTDNQTPPDLSVTGELNKLSRSIRGRGRANAEIRSDVNDRRTAVDSQGNYTLDVGQNALASKDNVRVIEVFNNSFNSVTEHVHNPYKLTAPEVLYISRQNIKKLTRSTKFEEFTNNFSQYLKNTDGIKVTLTNQKSDPKFSADKVEYIAILKESGKSIDAATLKNLQPDNILRISLCGVNVDNQISTEPVGMDIRLDSKVPSLIPPRTLEFNEVVVPERETLFQLRESPILGIHNLSSANKCSVSVSVGPITSKQGEKFAGQLVYWDGTQQRSLEQSYSLYQSSGQTGDMVSISDDWYQSQNGQRGKGIYLAVEPNVKLNNYSGTMTWTLNNVPSR